MKHTPEPWRYVHSQIVNAEHIVADHPRDAERIKACVNACAGMKDPGKTIPALIEANRVMRDEIKSILDAQDKNGALAYWLGRHRIERLTALSTADKLEEKV